MQPIAFSIAEACAACHIGRTRIYEAIREGQLSARKHGRRTLIVSADLHRWLENLPAFDAGQRTHTTET
jgi:excisionase family DNA binding protein